MFRYLSLKCEISEKLEPAYKQNNTSTLAAITNTQLPALLELTQNCHAQHKALWMALNKPFGWEVFDIRYGGLLMRFDTAKERITAYLAGELSAIEELEAPSLRLDGTAEDDPRLNSGFLWGGYQKYATVSKI